MPLIYKKTMLCFMKLLASLWDKDACKWLSLAQSSHLDALILRMFQSVLTCSPTMGSTPTEFTAKEEWEKLDWNLSKIWQNNLQVVGSITCAKNEVANKWRRLLPGTAYVFLELAFVYSLDEKVKDANFSQRLLNNIHCSTVLRMISDADNNSLKSPGKKKKTAKTNPKLVGNEPDIQASLI